MRLLTTQYTTVSVFFCVSCIANTTARKNTMCPTCIVKAASVARMEDDRLRRRWFLAAGFTAIVMTTLVGFFVRYLG